MSDKMIAADQKEALDVIHTGEVIVCQPNLEHWQGASPGSSMTHISLNTNADK